MKKIYCALTSLLLACCLLFSGCAARGKTIMKAGGEKISVNVFELYLSRMKGSLGTAGYAVTSDDFWNTYISTDNRTTADYYTDQVFEGLRQIAAALILYDELGLKLEKTAEDEIDTWIDKLIEEVGEGSKSQLNSVLSAFGANITTLRDSARIEAKISQLKTYLYGTDGSLIADTAKEEYYKATYFRGYQMQLANYYYDREKDADGNTVFYTDENYAHIAYLSESETVSKRAEKDSFGDDCYVYTESGKIAYDTEKGYPQYYYDTAGNHKICYYTEEENQLRLNRANEIASRCVGNEELFLQCIEDWSDNLDFNTQYAPNGMYFSVGTYGTDSIFATFSTELAKLEVGELTVLESDSGYYILMRAELDDGAWGVSENSRWFSTFTGMTLEYMLQQRTAEYLDRVTVNEKLRESVNITSVSPNYYY